MPAPGQHQQGHGLREGLTAGWHQHLFSHPTHQGPGRGSLQGDDRHGKVEVQAVLALSHVLFSLELTHHVIHILLLPRKKAQGRQGIGKMLSAFSFKNSSLIPRVPLTTPSLPGPSDRLWWLLPKYWPGQVAKQQTCSFSVIQAGVQWCDHSLLLSPAKCWDYNHEPPHPAFFFSFWDRALLCHPGWSAMV